jgi:hypothetical protein
MTGAQITSPKTTAPRLGRSAAILGLGFAAGLLAALAFTASIQSKPGVAEQATLPSAISRPDADAYEAYRTTLSDLTTAVRRHDGQQVARFRVQLGERMTPEAVGAIYAERAQLLASLAAAEARHDPRMRAEFASRLAALCPPVHVTPSLSFCD